MLKSIKGAIALCFNPKKCLNLLIILKKLVDMPFKGGAKPKHLHLPLVSELRDAGYGWHNLHILLHCAKDNIYKVFQQPDDLKLSQIKAISFALQKPLPYVINKLMGVPPKSIHWLDENYSPDKHLEDLKNS
ncbi:MAG: hypothetical protein IPP56_13635 [Bacteroidetes bacterium]|nr:hypothetical protein [Bacteroidota bacterium]